ncbi:MAG TPA: HAD-IIIA family hydrolase [Nevskiales bacterium]|nr:HAD-IIIA family hydrolase [Nevskiales bacterium]
MARKPTPAALRRKAARIELAVFDVDGVMTDGRLYVGPGGQEFKAVHIHDGHGLKRLMAAGVEVAVISGRRSEAIEARLADLGVEHVFMGAADKLAIFCALLEELNLEPHQVAYMGDDEPDLGPMRVAGLALAVRNAVPEIRAAADWVSTRDGGDGAVREACELLIAARGRR